MMMQPGYVPMMNMPSRGPFPMGGMVDPSMMMNRMPRPPLPPPMGGVMPVSMVSMIVKQRILCFLVKYSRTPQRGLSETHFVGTQFNEGPTKS